MTPDPAKCQQVPLLDRCSPRCFVLALQPPRLRMSHLRWRLSHKGETAAMTTVSAPAELLAGEAADAPVAPAERILVNRTNKHLEIDAPDGTAFVLPPLSRRSI